VSDTAGLAALPVDSSRAAASWSGHWPSAARRVEAPKTSEIESEVLDRLEDVLNARQSKALLRLTLVGPVGFESALTRTGQLRGTRYWLPFGAFTGPTRTSHT
jgi:hypothetical protein